MFSAIGAELKNLCVLCDLCGEKILKFHTGVEAWIYKS